MRILDQLVTVNSFITLKKVSVNTEMKGRNVEPNNIRKIDIFNKGWVNYKIFSMTIEWF
jgi:hypothetical protein